MITPEVKESIQNSVLCWLATADCDNVPNVSPKEMFTFFDDQTLLIANIASPNSLRNIEVNPNVCVSFINIFIQKGYKIKGTAQIITEKSTAYLLYKTPIVRLFSDQFPISAIIEIHVKSVQPILAPSYFLFPESTTEKSQFENAMRTYKVRPE